MTEHNWYLCTESRLEQQFSDYIAPFWHEHVTQGSFQGNGDIRVSYAYCVPEQARQSVLISSGRIESLLKYKEVIYELYRNGFAVFVLDHRGQGLSGRMTVNPHQGYIDDFQHYVEDMCHFIDEIVTPQQRGALNLLCHSMGSTIGALTILQRPAQFNRVVFGSPMFGIRPALPEWLAKVLIGVNRCANWLLPGSSGYFFGQRDYHVDDFMVNRLTSSEIRYQIFRNLYAEQPEIQLGGVTPQWLAAASAAMWKVEQHGSEMTIPALVFSATEDTVVDNKRQQRVAASFANAEYIAVAGARHEILIERDAIRQPVMTRVLDFFTG